MCSFIILYWSIKTSVPIHCKSFKRMTSIISEFLLFFHEKSKTYRFGTSWFWVKTDISFFLGETISLRVMDWVLCSCFADIQRFDNPPTGAWGDCPLRFPRPPQAMQTVSKGLCQVDGLYHHTDSTFVSLHSVRHVHGLFICICWLNLSLSPSELRLIDCMTPVNIGKSLSLDFLSPKMER